MTKIEVQKRNPHRRSIFLDGSFFCGVDEEVVARLDLGVGSEVDEDTIGTILLTEERLKARQYALNLLSYRMRSKKELAKRMLQKGFERKAVDEIVGDLEEVGLVDDLEFARSWIRTRMEVNPRSFYALERELRLKGVDRDICKQVEKDLKGEFDEREIALALGKKRRRTLDGLPPVDARRRLMGYLSRRGFSYEVAKWVMGQLEEDSG